MQNSLKTRRCENPNSILDGSSETLFSRPHPHRILPQIPVNGPDGCFSPEVITASEVNSSNQLAPKNVPNCEHKVTLEMSTLTIPRKLRTENINLRVTHNQKAVIDQAAATLGRSRSDFMLYAVCQKAESVLLDRRYFVLSKAAFKRFTDLLDKPPASNPLLERLLRTKAPWDKQTY